LQQLARRIALRLATVAAGHNFVFDEAAHLLAQQVVFFRKIGIRMRISVGCNWFGMRMGFDCHQQAAAADGVAAAHSTVLMVPAIGQGQVLDQFHRFHHHRDGSASTGSPACTSTSVTRPGISARIVLGHAAGRAAAELAFSKRQKTGSCG